MTLFETASEVSRPIFQSMRVSVVTNSIELPRRVCVAGISQGLRRGETAVTASQHAEKMTCTPLEFYSANSMSELPAERMLTQREQGTRLRRNLRQVADRVAGGTHAAAPRTGGGPPLALFLRRLRRAPAAGGGRRRLHQSRVERHQLRRHLRQIEMGDAGPRRIAHRRRAAAQRIEAGCQGVDIAGGNHPAVLRRD